MIFGIALLVNGTAAEWRLLGALLLAVFAIAAVLAHRLNPNGTERLFVIGSSDAEGDDFK